MRDGCIRIEAPRWSVADWDDDYQDMLENLRRRLEQRGVNARAVVEAGDPRIKLCEVAERERPDLMVIGHRTTKLLNLVQLGSVALHCIEHSPASVLVVRV